MWWVGQSTTCRIQVVGSSEVVGRSDDYSLIKLMCFEVRMREVSCMRSWIGAMKVGQTTSFSS